MGHKRLCDSYIYYCINKIRLRLNNKFATLVERVLFVPISNIVYKVYYIVYAHHCPFMVLCFFRVHNPIHLAWHSSMRLNGPVVVTSIPVTHNTLPQCWYEASQPHINIEAISVMSFLNYTFVPVIGTGTSSQAEDMLIQCRSNVGTASETWAQLWSTSGSRMILAVNTRMPLKASAHFKMWPVMEMLVNPSEVSRSRTPCPDITILSSLTQLQRAANHLTVWRWILRE